MRLVRYCAVSYLVFALAGSAFADGTGDVKDGIRPPSIATSLPSNGDPGGIRKMLADRGILYNLVYTNDMLSNVSGGSRRGTIDQGKLEFIFDVDLEKLAGWRGLKFYTNGFYIHNTGRIRRDYVGGINTIAAIEAVPTVRLSEIWLEQQFAQGQWSVRAGQLAADTEFFFSGLSALFLQSDWATIAASNLPSGGAAYPLSTPGIRFKYDPTKDISLLFALLNGDPAGPGAGDEQIRNKHGLNFRVNDPAFVIGEFQHRTNQDNRTPGLARTLKVGAWAHLGRFNDQRFGSDGLPLASLASNGIPLQRRGNNGVYAVIDQQIYRPAGAGPADGISVYSRASFSPSDRNLISAYIDGGIVFAGMIPQRPNDSFGAAVIYSRFSNSVRGFDLDTAFFTGAPAPIRDFEANLELSYSAEIVSGWNVLPTIQHIWHPSGIAGRNATVVGARSIVKF